MDGPDSPPGAYGTTTWATDGDLPMTQGRWHGGARTAGCGERLAAADDALVLDDDGPRGPGDGGLRAATAADGHRGQGATGPFPRGAARCSSSAAGETATPSIELTAPSAAPAGTAPAREVVVPRPPIESGPIGTPQRLISAPPQNGDYRIGTDDEIGDIRLQRAGFSEGRRSFDPAGNISFPLAGEVGAAAAGLRKNWPWSSSSVLRRT